MVAIKDTWMGFEVTEREVVVERLVALETSIDSTVVHQ